jgi:hypothetical protein
MYPVGLTDACGVNFVVISIRFVGVGVGVGVVAVAAAAASPVTQQDSFDNFVYLVMS